MNNLYTQQFMHHYRTQPYKKILSNPTSQGESKNLQCGDSTSVSIVVKDGIIKDIGYNPDGCAISVGAISILAEYVIGKKINEVKKLTHEDFFKLLKIELTPAREKCALVGYEALMAAIKENDND